VAAAASRTDGGPAFTFPTDGARNIAWERRRQIINGWGPEHDDEHADGMLAKVAASLAVEHTDARIVDPNTAGEDFGDPWSLLARNTDAIRRLEIAGALIAAEIDRLLRKESAQ